MTAEREASVAVIGAGVIGLSTAVCIQENIPSAIVSIFADKFDSDIVSDGAGGLFRPSYAIDSDKKKVFTWCKSSLDYFLNIPHGKAGETGVQHVCGYHLSSSPAAFCRNPLLAELLSVQDVSKEEMSLFPENYKHGTAYSTLIIDCRYYLPWLKKRFLNSGGRIKSKKVENLTELADHYEVVVNCTGLGAKELLNDHLLLPIRGQTIKVKAPWIKHFYYGDDVYIIPGIDFVTLGGIKDFDNWNMQVNPYQKQFIWDRCLELVPSLQQAEFQWDWVGLRPYRTSVRLDALIVECNGKFQKIVNNYGHGGHGVTLSWGTAKEATCLVENLLADAMLVARL